MNEKLQLPALRVEAESDEEGERVLRTASESYVVGSSRDITNEILRHRSKSRSIYTVSIVTCPKCGEPGKLHATIKQLRIKKGRKSKNHPFARTTAGATIYQGPYGEVTHTKRCYIGRIPETFCDPKTGKLLTVRDPR